MLKDACSCWEKGRNVEATAPLLASVHVIDEARSALSTTSRNSSATLRRVTGPEPRGSSLQFGDL